MSHTKARFACGRCGNLPARCCCAPLDRPAPAPCRCGCGRYAIAPFYVAYPCRRLVPAAVLGLERLCGPGVGDGDEDFQGAVGVQCCEAIYTTSEAAEAHEEAYIESLQREAARKL